MDNFFIFKSLDCYYFDLVSSILVNARIVDKVDHIWEDIFPSNSLLEDQNFIR